MSTINVNNVMPVTGNTVNINGVIMTNGVLSATTYENIPTIAFTGGTISGATEFVGGVTANTVSATTFYGDGSNLTGITGVTDLILVTYSELVDMISGGTLSHGSFYSITDFRTCYDMPEYYADGSMKLSGATGVVGAVEPIVVLATSENTISSTAYQPAYPNDRIQYDWTWNQTEISLNAAFGRITERIDEYNNRTDYDHRNIEFIRYTTYDKGLKISGYITAFDCNTGILNGVDSLFLSEVSNGEIIYFEWQNGLVGVKVISASTDTQLVVFIDPTFTAIAFENGTIPMYRAINQEYYGNYKEAYIGQYLHEDFTTYPTFNLNGTALHNYVGDYSRFFIQGILDAPGFLLSNNVFYSENSDIFSNTIGNMSYNNTFMYSFQTNTIGDRFYNNVGRQHGFMQNVIGNRFHNNKIMNYVNGNVIRDSFYENIIVSSFNNNEIGTYSYGNEFYSDFYDNKIGNDFYSNVIGDSGNLGRINFYRNVIGNYFNNNKIRQEFQNNKIGNQFEYNVANGDFYKNVIGNGFNDNGNIGYNFSGNHIGNAFNNNELIGDYFQDNKIGEYFENNSISYFFQNNQINNNFYNNTLGDTQYFSWNNLTIDNLTGRTYDTFYDSLYGDGGENIGNVILGKELIMHDTVNDQYHIVKFTQWTQGNRGGGFSYERTLVWPTEGPTVYFTKTNYGEEVDVIYSGSVEITRGNNGSIYNIAVEGGSNSSSPANTEWNSIYTQPFNGSYFQDNRIDNEFKGNYIRDGFYQNNVGSYVGSNHFSGQTGDNLIGSYVFDNDFLGGVYSNNLGSYFNNNTIGDYFRVNSFVNNTYNNVMGNNFSYNEIGFSFSNNVIGINFGYGVSTINGNKIGNRFENNEIADNFYSNIISDYFSYNTIGNNFRANVLKTNVNGVDFNINYGNVTGFTYLASGDTATDDTYYGIVGITSGSGVNASFNIHVSGNTVVAISGANQGVTYSTGDTIVISGTQIGGSNLMDDITITVTEISPNPSVFELYTSEIFERRGGDKRLSFYDESDILNITNINE